MTDNKEDRFVVDDDSTANWALKKLRKLKNKRKEKEEFAEEEKEKVVYEIEQWLEEETRDIDRSIDYFEGLLTEYAMQKKEKEPDLKTHKLPFGKLQFRKQRPKWKYNNDELLESVSKSTLADKLIEHKPKLDKRKLKKAVVVTNDGQVVIKDTGELIKGVEVIERGEKFEVKVNE